MTWLILSLIIVILVFGFVVMFGAPYVPTLDKQREQALDLLGLQPGQVLIELGSGDGGMLIAAAKRGIKSVGYELNPLLFAYSWLTTRRYRNLISVRLGNFWHKQLPECDGIYVFLLDRFMDRLHKKITQEIIKPVKVVSYAFKIPKAKQIKEVSGFFLYKYTTKTPI